MPSLVCFGQALYFQNVSVVHRIWLSCRQQPQCEQYDYAAGQIPEDHPMIKPEGVCLHAQ